MDVSTAPHNHSEPDPPPTSRTSQSAGPYSGALEPVHRATPLRHGLMMGFATAISVALSFCCLLSVASRLGPDHHILNAGLGLVSILAGIYVGFRSWQKQKAPRPASRGRCPDCGREVMSTDTACSLCGRKVSSAAGEI